MNEDTRQDMDPETSNHAHAGRTLGEFFDAARKDVRPTLLERQDAEELIQSRETTVQHRLDLKQGWVRRNLLSSPIRIGVTLMTTSAFASLMVIAVSQFTSTAPPATRHSSAVPSTAFVQPQSLGQHAEPRVTNSTRTRVEYLPVSEPLKPAQSPLDFSAKATDSDTLHAVELNPDQLARLGVELPDNGDIVVYYPKANGGAQSWRFTTRGQLSQTIGGPTNSSLSVNPLPYAITYPMGEAMMYSHFIGAGDKPDILIGMTPGVSHKYAERYAALRGEDPSDQTSFGVSTDATETSQSGHTRTKTITQVHTNSPENGASILVHPSVAPQIGQLVPVPGTATVTIVGNDMPPPPPPSITMHDPRSTGDSAYHQVKRRVHIISTATLDSTLNGVMLSSACNVDSLIRSLGLNGSSDSGHRIMNVESIVRAFGGDSSTSRFIARDVFTDSTLFPTEMNTEAGAKSIRKLLSVIRTDSTLGSTRSNLFIRRNSSINGPSFSRRESLFRDSSLNAPVISGRDVLYGDAQNSSFEQFYRKHSGDTTSWSSLIPVRVTNYNTPEHHTLIFWYERTPEVMNIVPRSAVERADARPKNLEISVYPNPTQGETNVHYVVKNGEPVTINVVSLLGQKLIEGGARPDQHGDMSLDLSSLEPGVYLLVATLQNGEKAVERVVVTK
jgi:hypothetical protein